MNRGNKDLWPHSEESLGYMNAKIRRELARLAEPTAIEHESKTTSSAQHIAGRPLRKIPELQAALPGCNARRLLAEVVLTPVDDQGFGPGALSYQPGSGEISGGAEALDG
jgi:hypothetical protein